MFDAVAAKLASLRTYFLLLPGSSQYLPPPERGRLFHWLCPWSAL